MTVTVVKAWWCPTCQRRIPQPRWHNVGKPDQVAYHLDGLTVHHIERIEVLDAEVLGIDMEEQQ